MTPEQKQKLRQKIDLGLKISIARTLDEHARAGRTVTIWRDGQMVKIVPPLSSDAVISMAVKEEPPPR